MPTQSTRLLTILCCAIGFCPYGAHAQDPSANDILKKVDEKYQRVSSFNVVAERAVDLDTDTSGQEYTMPKREQIGASHESDYIQVTLVTSGLSKAKLLLKDGKKEIVVVADGNAVWTLMPAQHAYTKVTGNTANPQTPVYQSGMYFLRKYEWLLAARFRSISSDGAGAKLQDSETLKVGKDKKECYVLTRSMGTQKYKVWVDKKDFIVWKTVETTVAPEGWPGVTLQTTETVSTKQLILNPLLDESNFVFAPPDRAKRVDSLKLSGNNPF